MKIKIEDVKILSGSIHIKKINKKKDVEKLYFLSTDFVFPYSFDVVDYDYMNFLVIELSREADAAIVNSKEERDKFISLLIESINEILK